MALFSLYQRNDGGFQIMNVTEKVNQVNLTIQKSKVFSMEMKGRPTFYSFAFEHST